MLCIICNEHPEKDWPKRWQCWKENGKFSESLCKLLGLPKFPYKEDFQNSLYCSSCQKRVYDVYLMVRKWERVQDEINKLKSKLKKDFQQSLQKGDRKNGSKKGRSKGKQNDESTWNPSNGKSNYFEEENGFELKKILKKENGINDKVDETGALFELMVVRKRILQRLDKRNCDWDCDCCFDSQPKAPTKKYPPVEKGKFSLPPCGFPDCQDKECWKWKRNTHNDNGDRSGSESDDDGHSSSSGSDTDSSQDHENRCNDEFCTTCNFSSDGPQGEDSATTSKENQEDSTSHSNSKNKMTPCSSEYCADCAICKDEARRSRRNSGKSKSDCANTTNANAKTGANEETSGSGVSIKNEVVSGTGSPDELEVLEFESFGKIQPKDSPPQETMKQENCSTDTDAVSPEENEEEWSPDADNDNNAKYEYSERFRCNWSSCTRTFVTQDDLDIHVKRHHEGIKCPYLCQQCGKAFQWRRELTAHVLKHSGEVAICCHICGRGFRTLQLFNVHTKTKHGGERKYKCSSCDKAFISESKLNTHLTIHTKVYPFTCTICGKGFSAKTFLSFHMSKHMDANPYQCTICSKTFSSPRNLKVHQYTHTQSHPFKCPICQAGATSETLLKKHMLKHNSEKSHVCHTCNKKFRFPSSLKKHQKVHNGEKRFKCEFCNKTFIDKYKLTRHLRTHSGDKPFHCTKCKKRFSTTEYLNKHNIQNHNKDLQPQSSSSIKDNDVGSTASSSSSDQDQTKRPIHNHQTSSSSSSEDLQLPEINEPLSAYLMPDDFTTDPSFLDNLNPADNDLVVTALDLENFSKEELMLTGVKSENPDHENFPGGVASENQVPNSNMLPDFQSFRRSSTERLHDQFSFTYHHL